ncbi:MAG: DMT family transporter [Bacillaceae bacterium]|nr:DMT family transporter [Bacillaceae bacterium]
MHQKVMIYMAALANAAIVGLSFLFTKIALNETTPMDTLGHRFTIAWMVLSVFFLLSKESLNFLKVKKMRELWPILLLALFYPTLFFSFQAFGLEFTTSAEGGIILAFSPALTAIFAAIFLKEKVNMIQGMFIALSIFGVLYIFIMNGVSIQFSGSHTAGIILLLFSCISIAGYAVLARHLSVSYKPIHLSYIMVTFGFIFFNLFVLIQRSISGTLSEYASLLLNHQFLIAVAFLGIFATMITSLLANYVLSKLSAAKMSVFSNLSTVISIIAGVVILDEQVHSYHLLGSALIIAGVIGTNLTKQKPMKTSVSKIPSEK